ncbi:ABC transporter ATP-binding protein [Haladaptatus sp. DJG-WS-42]|uniref:ABC transporter ATP-binding protein n=1 Tax=Haladaptatus sp. DJG-WS-42 TaxID=3120516 RepID=UPI0030CE9D75
MATHDERPVVAVSGLSKVFSRRGKQPVTAVDDVSFAVGQGSVVGLLGPNGAGKTTTIKAILGLVTPTSGSIRVGGVDVQTNPREVYRNVSAVLEGSRNIYWRLSPRQNVDFFTSLQGIHPKTVRQEHDDLFGWLGLTEKVDDPVTNLSRGMKQKTALACAIARNTDVLFLDEPTLGLDVETSLDLRRELRRLAKHDGKTILISSHDMDVVQDVCDRVIIMNEGRIVADERIADLIALFRSQTYRIAVSHDEAALRAHLREFEVTDWANRDGFTEFDVVLRDGDRFYELMETLRTERVALESVMAIEPDLEDVFLTVTDNEAAR